MWLVEKLGEVKSKAAAVGTGAVVAILTAVPAFAADGVTAGGSSVADTMGTAFTAVQTDFTATVAKIAPGNLDFVSLSRLLENETGVSRNRKEDFKLLGWAA